VLYSVRSERLLMEQLDYNLLFRWFVAWPWMTRSGTPRCSPKPGAAAPRDIARPFSERVRAQAEQRGLLSDEHFTATAP